MRAAVNRRHEAAMRRKHSPMQMIHPTIGSGKETDMLRALDLPMAILLHMMLGIVGLTLMGMGALFVCVAAAGAAVSGLGTRRTA